MEPPVPPKVSAEVVGDLIAKLRHGVAVEKLQAIAALTCVDPISATAPAVDILVGLLREDADQNVREQAASALGRLPLTASAVEALGDALNDQSSTLRVSAAQAIPLHPNYMRYIIAGLKSPHHEVRWQLTEKIRMSHLLPSSEGMFGSSLRMSDSDAEEMLTLLTAALNDPSQFMRNSSCLALARIGKGAQAAVPLAAVLSGSEWGLRVMACRGLAEIGPEAKQAGSALVELLKLQNNSLRYEAAKALAATGGASPADLPVLTNRLSSTDPYERQFCAQIIGQMGDQAAEAVPDLIYAAQHDIDANVRESAIEALGRIGAAARPAIPEIIRFLQNRTADNKREGAAEALGAIAESSDQSVIDALSEALKDLNENVRQSAMKALQRMSVSESEIAKASQNGVDNSLVNRVRDADGAVRYEALWQLRRLWQNDPLAIDPLLVPDLSAILQHKDQNIFNRANAAFLLGMIGSEARGAVDALIASMNEQGTDGNQIALTSSALEALISIAPEDQVVLNAVNVEMLKTVINMTRTTAPAIAKSGKSGVPYLLIGLTSGDPIMINDTASALGSLGETAKEAVPPLLKLLESRDLLNPLYATCSAVLCNGLPAVLLALASIAPGDENVVNAIIDISRETDTTARNAAAQALRKIGSPRALDAALWAEKLPAQSGPNDNADLLN